MASSPTKQDRRARFGAWTAAPDAAMAELCDWIETRGAEGHLLAFSRAKDFAYTTLRDWIDADAARSSQYARATVRRADVMADDIVTIADADPGRTPQGACDAAAVAHQRLRVESRKWVASKLAPRSYGDRVELDATIHVDQIRELVEHIHRVGSRLPIKA